MLCLPCLPGPANADELARRNGMSKFGGGLTPYVFVGERLAGTEHEAGTPKGGANQS